MEKFDIILGKGYGISEIDAFDEALYQAGINDYNLVKVSSIIPESAKKADFAIAKKYIKKGSIIHIAYSVAYIYPDSKEEYATAGVKIALTNKDYGIIMEYHGTNKIDVEEMLEKITHNALQRRGLKLIDNYLSTIRVKKKKNNIGCAFVGVPIW